MSNNFSLLNFIKNKFKNNTKIAPITNSFTAPLVSSAASTQPGLFTATPEIPKNRKNSAINNWMFETPEGKTTDIAKSSATETKKKSNSASNEEVSRLAFPCLDISNQLVTASTNKFIRTHAMLGIKFEDSTSLNPTIINMDTYYKFQDFMQHRINQNPLFQIPKMLHFLYKYVVQYPKLLNITSSKEPLQINLNIDVVQTKCPLLNELKQNIPTGVYDFYGSIETTQTSNNALIDLCNYGVFFLKNPKNNLDTTIIYVKNSIAIIIYRISEITTWIDAAKIENHNLIPTSSGVSTSSTIFNNSESTLKRESLAIYQIENITSFTLNCTILSNQTTASLVITNYDNNTKEIFRNWSRNLNNIQKASEYKLIDSNGTTIVYSNWVKYPNGFLEAKIYTIKTHDDNTLIFKNWSKEQNGLQKASKLSCYIHSTEYIFIYKEWSTNQDNVYKAKKLLQKKSNGDTFIYKNWVDTPSGLHTADKAIKKRKGPNESTLVFENLVANGHNLLKADRITRTTFSKDTRTYKTFTLNENETRRLIQSSNN